MPETPLIVNDQDDRTARIRALNDQLRQEFAGGEILMTPGISALAQDTLIRVIEAVRSFDDFTPDNDPWRTHDCALLDVEGVGEKIMFKLDAYDLSHRYASPDETDPAVTARVMTVLLASEY